MGKLLDQVSSLVPHQLLQYAQENATPVVNLLQPAAEWIEPRLRSVQGTLDASFAGYQPWEILLTAVASTLIFVFGTSWILSAWHAATEDGMMSAFYSLVRRLPVVKRKLEAEKDQFQKSLLEGRHAVSGNDEDLVTSLPRKGLPATVVLERLKTRAKRDVHIPDGHSMISGAVYLANAVHKRLLDNAYSLFSTSNPLHVDVFPSVRVMEAEVISIAAGLLGGGAAGDPEVCGAMTSGGTESILMAMKASRDYMRAHKGIRKPEIIIARSAHAAYFKAAEYFKLKLVVAPVGHDLRLSADTVRRHLTRNTVAVVASAPGFPHGVIDHVSDIAAVTRRADVCLHVDACLGGFVLPFAKRLGYPIPPFDFSVPGVTSMSVDTHKFGMAAKGTSVVLYRHRALRQHQFTSITDWTGGLYISPGLAGSRSGALIATAWASLVHLGEDGLLACTQQIMDAAGQFIKGLSAIPELEIVGSPDMSVVAFKARGGKGSINIYKVNDLMTKKGWHLNALQFPAALHFCFTAMHINVVNDLLKDLADAVKSVRENPDCISGGSAPMYGKSAVIPDRGMVAEFLVAYQDVMLMP